MPLLYAAATTALTLGLATAVWLLVERPAMTWGLTLPSLGVDARCDKPGQPA